MGFFDIFRKAPSVEDFDTTPSQHITFALTAEELDINGTKLTMPCHKDELTGIFGDYTLSMDNIGGTGVRYIYLWHKLGIVAYSRDDESVNCISLQLFPNEKKYALNSTKNIFGGTVTVDGADWMTLFVDEKQPKLDGMKLPFKLVHHGNFTLCASVAKKPKGQVRSLGINKKTELKLGG
ncbi:MAG: hypothetical protein E7478_05865 [Ruminococcaceae bacterium]|nr:hypothetical protein [Oscillospiraceae bacterium]